MHKMWTKPFGLSLLPCLVIALLCGCGGDGTGDYLLKDANKTNLDRICTLYFSFQMQNQNKGPADEAAFREFLSKRPAEKLEKIGVDPANLDALFVSDRDGEKFEILWGVNASPRDEPVAIVAESVGVDGKRMIGFHKKPHKEVEEAEYKQLFSK